MGKTACVNRYGLYIEAIMQSRLRVNLTNPFLSQSTHACYNTYMAFHGFEQAKFAYGGSVLGSSQFTLLPQQPLKTMLNLKMVKIDSEKSYRYVNLNPLHTLCYSA